MAGLMGSEEGRSTSICINIYVYIEMCGIMGNGFSLIGLYSSKH